MRNLLLCGFVLLLTTAPAFAAPVTLLYPEAPAPYDKVFENIITGFESQSGRPTRHIAVTKTSTPEELQARLTSGETSGVVALGSRVCRLAQSISNAVPIICGATPLYDQGVSGISLDISPGLLFTHLKDLAPAIRRVFVVYTPRYSDWVIDLARRDARAAGIELVALPEESLRDAAQRYRELFDGQIDRESALWLPLDPVTVSDDVILPMVLKAAWEGRVTVFSSKPAHAKQGVLFSLYPDNEALGRELARMAKARFGLRNVATEVLPLAEAKLAVNVRTASHLGLSFSAEQEALFSLIFPGR